MARKLYTDYDEAEMVVGDAEPPATVLLTVDEYKTRVATLAKLNAAAEALAGETDPAFVEATEHMFSIVQKLGDSLAFALAHLARHGEALKASKKHTMYWLDDIWEALGRYAYHVGDDTGVACLLDLRYSIEKMYQETAVPEVAVGVGTQPEPQAAALVRAAAADSESLPVGEAMDEWEREQTPDPGLIRN